MNATETDATTSRLTGTRKWAYDFVWSKPVQTFVIVVIVVNAIMLGLQTSEEITRSFGDLLHVLDQACLVVYIVELALKLFGGGWSFFRSGWNVFDFVIVAVTLIPANEGTAVLRALRVLRTLRLISVVPSLRRVVDGLGKALPGIGAVGALLVIIFYVGAVMSVTLFGETFPQWFGSLKASLFTLFQMMTFDDWGNITRAITEEYPLAPVFFIVFVFLSALTVLNLIIAVIVDAMQSVGSVADDEEPAAADEVDPEPSQVAEPESEPSRKDLHDEILALRAEVQSLSRLLTSRVDPDH